MSIKNIKYEQTYQTWVNSLSPKKQAKLKKLGLDKPLDDNGRLNTPNNADVVFANLGAEFDYDSMDEKHLPDDIESTAKTVQLMAWTLRRLFTEKPTNVHLNLECLAFALGDNGLIDDKTETELAIKYDTTRANVSFKVKEWQKLIGSKPSMMMKSTKACKKYRQIKLGRNNKNEKE